MYDIIIVGAGTAGLTAAIYGVRAGKSVLGLEAKTYGGQIINTPKIENYPGIKEISGFEYAKNLYEQAKELTTYLETSSAEDNSSFGTATIRSSFSHLIWGDLGMQPAGQVQVTLKELDGIMSCVQLSYLAERKNDLSV